MIPEIEPGTLTVDLIRYSLPVEIRDNRLTLVTIGTTGEPVRLPPGRYAISVPLPGRPPFRDAIEIASGDQIQLTLPFPLPLSRLDAATALVDQGDLTAALHVLDRTTSTIPAIESALLGFIALRLGDTERAQRAADRAELESPDILALQTALIRDRDAGRPDELVGSVTQALNMGTPRLTWAAQALVAALRDAGAESTPRTAELVRATHRGVGRTFLQGPSTDSSVSQPANRSRGEMPNMTGMRGPDLGGTLTTPDPMSDRPPAAGPADEDTAYRTHSPRFSRMELALDESVSIPVLFRLWLYAAAASLMVFMLFLLLALLALIGGAGSGSGVVLELGGVVSFAVFWVVLLATKIQEPVSEWKTLIDGKAAAAESSYAAIFHSLARRRIPVGVTPSRIRSDLMAGSVSNQLMITERSYVAHVSVFAFGTSLYVGWTMWRSRRGVALVGQFAKDVFGSVLGRTGIINQMIRTERVRAMREAVHSAVCEGADVAVEGIHVPIAATFGYEIPTESASAAAPAPAFVPGTPP